jgi:hypothetical protein
MHWFFRRLIGYLFKSHEQVQKGLTWNIEQLGNQNSSFWAVVLLHGESVRVFSFSMSWSSWLFESDTGWGHSYTFSVVGSNIEFDGGCILVFGLELAFGSLASLFRILLWIYVLWSKPAWFIEVCIQKASLPCSLGQVISKSHGGWVFVSPLHFRFFLINGITGPDNFSRGGQLWKGNILPGQTLCSACSQEGWHANARKETL